MPRLRHRFGGLALALSWFLTSSGLAPAQAAQPEAPLLFAFAGNERVYLLEGIERCETVDGENFQAERCIALDLIADARGRYIGTASVEFEGGISGALNGSVRGKQQRAGRGTRFALQGRLRGVIQLPLIPDVPARMDLRCRGRISESGEIDSSCDLMLRVPGARPTREEVALPAETIGGEWTLEIATLLDVGRGRLEGSATDSFGFSYQIRGRYDERRDRSQLDARGLRNSLSHGARVKLRNLVSAVPSQAVGSARFSVLGARGRADVNSEPR